MSLGLPSGKMFWKAVCMVGSANRSAIRLTPMSSMTSVKRILTKIRLDDVVSSSFMWTAWKTPHETASEAIRWPKRRPMLRSRFVSYRWIVS